MSSNFTCKIAFGGSLDFQIKPPGGRWLPEMSRIIRNNKLSDVHISVLLEDASYICTVYPDSILRPREHSKQTSDSTKDKAQIIPPVSFCYSLFSMPPTGKKQFFTYSVQVLSFKFLSVYQHEHQKVISNSMFYLSWKCKSLCLYFCHKGLCA